MVILGCDISTTISGYCILKDGELVKDLSVDTRNKNHYPTDWDAWERHKEVLKEIKSEFDIDEVYIEEPVKSFKSGFSSASTISTLSRFNGMISAILYEVFHIEPEYLHAATARKEAGLTVSQKSDKTGKEQAFEYIEETEDNFEYDLTYAGNPKPESKDRADSIVVARAAENLLENETKEDENT